MSHASNPQTMAWWKSKNPEVTLSNRVAQINRYRDSSTSADELLRFLRFFILPALLLYSGVLSFASYQAFFSHNFDPFVASLAAFLLAAVIEFGKAKMGLRFFQKPYLQGWACMKTSFAESSIWVCTFLFAAATFTMSVINSTRGGYLLSMKSGTERHATLFTPNTADIDAQIAQGREAINKAHATKWKGLTTYQSQQAIARESRAIDKLQSQREAAINTQRADYERQRAIDDKNTETGSSMLMAGGGWVELLTGLALFLIASCQSVLQSKMGGNTPPPPNGQHNYPHGQNLTYRHPTNIADGPLPHDETRRPLGFFWKGYGDAQPTHARSVTHYPPSVSHMAGAVAWDRYLKSCRQDVSRWYGNFDSKRHNDANCSSHINDIIDELRESYRRADFQPSRAEALTTYDYFTNLMPKLHERGWPYTVPGAFLTQLRASIPEGEAVQA